MPTEADAQLLRTEIAGIPVKELAREFGTPTYVYDAATIRRQIETLRAFDVIRYSQKANSNLAILDFMRRRGVLVDAVSTNEIRRALAAGYAADGEPAPIFYTADIFDQEALDAVVAHDVRVNCGSPDMIDQYGKRVSGGEVMLRINPGFGHGAHRKVNTGGEQSKHGIWHEQLGDCLARAERHDLKVTGLHMHIGSGSDLEHLARVVEAMETVAKEVGPSVHEISAGGGLPVPYQPGATVVDVPAYFKLWDDMRWGLEDAFDHKVRLEIEPGRYLVAECGYLLAEIRSVKTMGDNTFYLVDAGFNNLVRPVMYGAYQPISITPVGGPAERPLQDVVVGGPLCESGDIFTQEEGGVVVTRRLPTAQVGDYLVIECAGAYGFVMGSNYNGKPLAAEVLISDGGAHLIRERQTFDDLIRGEKIPITA